MSAIHHLTLTVTDAQRSADWYERLLGDAQVIKREGEGWSRIRLNWPNGLVIGFTQHDATNSFDSFDHTRVGLDHIGIACASQSEVLSWFDKIDGLGFKHGPIEDVPYGWAVTVRDPDNIAVEFFCSK